MGSCLIQQYTQDSPTQNFVEGNIGETNDIVAEKLDIGSGEQYRKEKFIVENKESLSPIQRITVTEKYRPYYEEKAKEKQGIRNDLNFPPKSAESNINKKERNRDNETDRQLAKLANVGHTAYLIRGTKFRSPYIFNIEWLKGRLNLNLLYI